MKKIFSILLVLVSALVLVSCKDKGLTVTFWHTMGKTSDPNEGGQALLEKFIKEFEEANPGVTIKHEAKGGYDDLASAVSKALVAGNQPTMSYSYTDHVAAYLRTGKVQSLDELIAHEEHGMSQEDLNDYVPAFLSEGRVYDEEGTLYSLPFAKSTEVMFYNKKFLAENDFEEFDGNNKNGEYTIITWDEAKDLSERIIDKNVTVDDFKATFGYDSDNNFYITSSAQAGIPYTKLPKGEESGILFNNDEAKDMMRYFKTLYDGKSGSRHFSTKEMLGANTSNFFIKEEVIFAIGSTGGTKYNIPAANGMFSPADIGIAPIPFYGDRADLEDNYKVIQQGPNINIFKKQNMDEVYAAWNFLKYITAPEQQAQWSKSSGYSPVRLGTYDVPMYKDYLDISKLDLTNYEGQRQAIFVEALKVAQYLSENNYFFVSPAFNKSSKARGEVGTIVKKVFGGQEAIDKIFKDAEDAANY